MVSFSSSPSPPPPLSVSLTLRRSLNKLPLYDRRQQHLYLALFLTGYEAKANMYALSSSCSLILLSYSLFISSTCERLRQCRDDEKHWNDKSADTIDIMYSLRHYVESIPFTLLGATEIMRVGGSRSFD